MSDLKPPVPGENGTPKTQAKTPESPQHETPAVRTLAFMRKGSTIMRVNKLIEQSSKVRGKAKTVQTNVEHIPVESFQPANTKFVYFTGIDKTNIITDVLKDAHGNVIGPASSRYAETRVRAITEDQFLNLVRKSFFITAQDTEDGQPVLNPTTAAEAYLLLANLTEDVVYRKFLGHVGNASDARKRKIAKEMCDDMRTIKYGNIKIPISYILYVPGLEDLLGVPLSEDSLRKKLPNHIKQMLA